MPSKTVWYVFAIVSALCSGPVWSQTKFHIASIASLSGQEIAAKMIAPIFKSAGYEIDIEPMPAERARIEATEGRKDGDLLRIFSYGEKNPTMIRVPTPYSTVETVAFALKSKNFSVKTKEDVAKYNVGIIRGVQTTRDLTEGMPKVQEISALDQGIKMLQAERIDILVTAEFGGLTMLKQLKIHDIAPVGAISSLPLYLYFNNKHKDVVGKIDAAIQEKAKSGELKKLRAKYEKEYLDAIP